ncbi:MAG: enoyl-CoA hydratase/isomerase family protein, partial [Cyanobacteria bacterium]|nr:enoyl-CoA hydratase/isomerase family protein [Cyanobacteriota bacterium]
VFLASLTLLRDGVCGPMDLENVARVALRWKQGPLGLMNQKTPAEVAACIDSVKTPGQAIPQIPQAPWDLTGVRTSTRNGVRYITLDRMGELNTLTGPVIQKVHDAVLAGELDPAVKVIVLESNGGKVLSAGADTKMFRDAPSMEASRGAIELGKQLLDRVAKSTKLTVAKVQGATFGASTELVLPFDRLIVTDDFSMKLPEVNIGLAPVWGGTERLLQKAGRPLGEAIILNGRFEFGLLKHLPKPLQKLVNGPLNIDIDKGTGFVLDAETGKRLGVFDAVVPRQHLDDTLETLLKDPKFLEKPNPNRGIEKYLSPSDYPQDIQDGYQLNNPKTFSPPPKLGRYSKRSWFLAKRLIDQVGTPQEGKLTDADHVQMYQDTQGKMRKVQDLKDLAMAMAQKRPLAFLKQLYSVLVK